MRMVLEWVSVLFRSNLKGVLFCEVFSFRKKNYVYDIGINVQ